jgi:hypothetical protein
MMTIMVILPISETISFLSFEDILLSFQGFCLNQPAGCYEIGG